MARRSARGASRKRRASNTRCTKDRTSAKTAGRRSRSTTRRHSSSPARSTGSPSNSNRCRQRKPDMSSRGELTSFELVAAITAFALSARAADAVLPKQEQPFGDATIGRTYKDSQAGTISLAKLPAGPPNILCILIYDAGYGQWGHASIRVDFEY